MPSLIFRRGLDLTAAVGPGLSADYHSPLIERVKQDGYQYRSGRLTVYLAREFGFCYGVDRAVNYAYQVRLRFPESAIYLTGEIIHNPHVNNKLRSQGVRFLTDPGESLDRLGPADVVVLPAFGVTVDELSRLEARGCTLVDTTCGSVLNVWRAVRRYAEDGFTSVIHGKVLHQETRATASQALRHPNGPFLIVLDRREAEAVCSFIRHGGDAAAFLARFAEATSPGFDPERHLARIGLANQTTMLMSESLAIGEMFRQALADRYGADALADHFRAFETICSATEDRQRAVAALLEDHPLDLMVVIGGYNSSNTCNLARICADRVPTYHIADTDGLVSPDEIRYLPVGGAEEVSAADWLPRRQEVAVGLTAGASTPDVIVGQVIERLALLAAEPGPAGKQPGSLGRNGS